MPDTPDPAAVERLHPLDVTPSELLGILGSADAPLLVDVRALGEYTGGHIPGTRLLPLPELAARASELPRERRILCVCRSGRRSERAAEHLRSLGYSAGNLLGGMVAWTGPVEEGGARP